MKQIYDLRFTIYDWGRRRAGAVAMGVLVALVSCVFTNTATAWPGAPASQSQVNGASNAYLWVTPQTLNGWVGGPEQFGAVGNGSLNGTGHDDTAAIQAAVNAATVGTGGGTVTLKNKYYLISKPIVITNAVNFIGVGVNQLQGSLSGGLSVYAPQIYPFLSGTVLIQTNPVDIFQITNASPSVNIHGMGLMWTTNLVFINTGYGINNTPPPLGGYMDQGIWSSTWDNVTVFGVQTNKYGFLVINGVCDDFKDLRCYGGGGFEIEANSNITPTGNDHFDECYFQDGSWGPAYAMYLHVAAGSLSANLFYFSECNFQDAAVNWNTYFPQLTGLVANPMGANYAFWADAGVNDLSFGMPDIENEGGGANLINFAAMPAALNYGGGAVAGGPPMITNLCALAPGPASTQCIPDLMTLPISFGPWYQGASDTAFGFGSGIGEQFRFLDNPTGASYYDFGMGMSAHYVTMYETAVSTSYGWQWGTLNQTTGSVMPTTFSQKAVLDQSGDFTVQGYLKAVTGFTCASNNAPANPGEGWATMWNSNNTGMFSLKTLGGTKTTNFLFGL